jgi:hypothetical protein
MISDYSEYPAEWGYQSDEPEPVKINGRTIASLHSGCPTRTRRPRTRRAVLRAGPHSLRAMFVPVDVIFQEIHVDTSWGGNSVEVRPQRDCRPLRRGPGDSALGPSSRVIKFMALS